MPDLRRLSVAAFFFVGATTLLASDSNAGSNADPNWIRPEAPTDPLIWGRKDGVIFGLPSEGGLRGPRGLIRVGILSPKTSQPVLVNYIAVEPVIAGPGNRSSRMAFSELEPSQMDPGLNGKRLWVSPIDNATEPAYRGKLESYPRRTQPVERLTVPIEVEPFTANGAKVHVLASIDSDHPDELRLSVYETSGTPPLQELTVTATMGNFERLRWLWLKNRIVDSRTLYDTYTGDAFVEHENYPIDEVLRNRDGGAIAICTANEPDPSSAANPQASPHWRYDLPKLTQYWRIESSDIEPDLRVRVNGRRVYWASHDPLPGGVAFENFELRQRYKAGQTFIFGLTQASPQAIQPPL